MRTLYLLVTYAAVVSQHTLIDMEFLPGQRDGESDEQQETK